MLKKQIQRLINYSILSVALLILLTVFINTIKPNKIYAQETNGAIYDVELKQKKDETQDFKKEVKECEITRKEWENTGIWGTEWNNKKLMKYKASVEYNPKTKVLKVTISAIEWDGSYKKDKAITRISYKDEAGNHSEEFNSNSNPQSATLNVTNFTFSEKQKDNITIKYIKILIASYCGYSNKIVHNELHVCLGSYSLPTITNSVENSVLVDDLNYIKSKPKFSYDNTGKSKINKVMCKITDPSVTENNTLTEEFVVNNTSVTWSWEYNKTLEHNKEYEFWIQDHFGGESNKIKYKYRNENMFNFWLFTDYGYTTHDGDTFYTNKPIKFDINNDVTGLYGKIVIKHSGASDEELEIKEKETEYEFTNKEDGIYTFEYYDKLGLKHKRKITIYYDRVNPVLNILNANNQAILDGTFNSGGFSFGYNDSLAGVKSYTIKKNGSDYTNLYAIGEKTVYFENGTTKYYTDRKTLFDLLKEKEKIEIFTNFEAVPENILKVVEKDKPYIFAGKMYYEWNGKYYARQKTLDEDLKIYIDNKIESTTKTICSEDGEYEIEVKDRAGNTTKKTFTIYNKQLTISLNIDNESVNFNDENFNNIVKNFIVTIDDLSGINKYFYKIRYRLNNEQEVTLNDNVLSSGILSQDGNYTIKAIDIAGNETVIRLVLDRTKPVIKVQNADTKEVLVDGAYTNAPVKFEIRDLNLQDNIVHIFELISGEWVNVSSDFQVGNLYFNALSLKELELNNNVYFATYKLGEKTYSIKGNMFQNRNLLVETLNSSFEELVEEKIYEAGMQVNFISDEEIALAKIGEKFFTWRYKVLNKQASIEQNKLVYDDIVISAVRKNALFNKAKEFLNRNILYISYDAFYINENEERTFKIVASDIAGNQEEKIFNIDTKMPLIELTGKKDGNIYTLVTENGVIYTNHAEVIINLLEDYKVYDKAGNRINVTANKISISEENKYYFKVVDRAGNIKDFNVILDRTPVTLLGSSYYDDILDIYYTNNINKMKLKDLFGIKEIAYNFYNVTDIDKTKTILTSNVLQSEVLSSFDGIDINEGKIVISVKDIAGNYISYTVILDNINPEVPILNQNKKYINKINEISLEDSGDYSSKLLSLTILNKKKVIIENGKEVIKDNNEINFSIENINLTKFTVNEFSAWIRNTGAVNDNGEYEIEVKDRAGNKNSFSFVLFLNDKSYLENIDSIKDSFKVLKHYVVNLPSYVFFDKAGKYSFKDLKTAQDFAVKYEITARVIKKSDGYMYISKSNPTVAEFYENKDSLMEVVKFYAYSYIEEENIYKNGNNNYYTIIDNNLNENSSYLTLSNIDNYNDIPTYRIKKNYIFKKGNNILNVPVMIKIAYINTLGQLENIIDIDTNLKIEKIFKDNHLMQGYYAVFEKDLANIKDYTKENIDYVIYYDNETPYVVADTTMGDGITHSTTFNKSFIDDNTNSDGENILRYVSYKITNINDNEDNGLAIAVLNGGGFKNKIYTSSEINDIPIISYENGYYGKIKISIYDRNYNVLEYSILIAGGKPKWTHSNEEDTKTPLTMKFSLDDSSNAFKNISIYKYALDSDNFELQNKRLIEKDSQGNRISIERLRYVFEEGGKYQVEYEDIFGRKYIETPIFFMRNLPFAKLIGVQNNGITNKSVSLIFDNNNDIYLFKKNNGNKEQLLSTEYERLQDNKSNKIEITILAYDGITDFDYEILLINKSDRSLYKEYYFSIDSIICEIKLTNSSNEIVNENTAINKPFKINVYEQGAKIEVKKKGSLNYYYEKNSLITEDGEYEITIRDRFGNIKTFIIVLDQVVNFEIKGNYYLEDEVYIANKSLEIYLKENIKSISEIAKKKEDGSYIINKEGKHEIEIIDKRDNSKKITVVIDYTAPTYALNGVRNNETTNSDVKIIIEDGSALQLLFNNNKIETKEKETILNNDGKYEFTVKDKAGNKSTGTFIIDKKVRYTTNFNINNFYTTENITINLLEDGNYTVKLNGKEIKDKKNNFTGDGEYEINIVDAIGNIENLKVTKIPGIAISYNLTLDKNIEIISVTLNSEQIEKNDFNFNKSGKYFIRVKDKSGKFQNLNFEVDSIKPKVEIKKEKGIVYIGNANKNNLTYTLYKNGKEIKAKNQIKEAGKYHLIIKDKLGNVNEYDFKIKRKMTIGGIIGLTLSIIALFGVTSYLLYRRHKMKVA